jgi:hypothetical protein
VRNLGDDQVGYARVSRCKYYDAMLPNEKAGIRDVAVRELSSPSSVIACDARPACDHARIVMLGLTDFPVTETPHLVERPFSAVLSASIDLRVFTTYSPHTDVGYQLGSYH